MGALDVKNCGSQQKKSMKVFKESPKLGAPEGRCLTG